MRALIALATLGVATSAIGAPPPTCRVALVTGALDIHHVPDPSEMKACTKDEKAKLIPSYVPDPTETLMCERIRWCGKHWRRIHHHNTDYIALEGSLRQVETDDEFADAPVLPARAPAASRCVGVEARSKPTPFFVFSDDRGRERTVRAVEGLQPGTTMWVCSRHGSYLETRRGRLRGLIHVDDVVDSGDTAAIGFIENPGPFCALHSWTAEVLAPSRVHRPGPQSSTRVDLIGTREEVSVVGVHPGKVSHDLWYEISKGGQRLLVPGRSLYVSGAIELGEPPEPKGGCPVVLSVGQVVCATVGVATTDRGPLRVPLEPGLTVPMVALGSADEVLYLGRRLRLERPSCVKPTDRSIEGALGLSTIRTVAKGGSGSAVVLKGIPAGRVDSGPDVPKRLVQAARVAREAGTAEAVASLQSAHRPGPIRVGWVQQLAGAGLPRGLLEWLVVGEQTLESGLASRFKLALRTAGRRRPLVRERHWLTLRELRGVSASPVIRNAARNLTFGRPLRVLSQKLPKTTAVESHRALHVLRAEALVELGQSHLAQREVLSAILLQGADDSDRLYQHAVWRYRELSKTNGWLPRMRQKLAEGCSRGGVGAPSLCYLAGAASFDGMHLDQAVELSRRVPRQSVFFTRAATLATLAEVGRKEHFDGIEDEASVPLFANAASQLVDAIEAHRPMPGEDAQGLLDWLSLQFAMLANAARIHDAASAALGRVPSHLVARFPAAAEVIWLDAAETGRALDAVTSSCRLSTAEPLHVFRHAAAAQLHNERCERADRDRSRRRMESEWSRIKATAREILEAERRVPSSLHRVTRVVPRIFLRQGIDPAMNGMVGSFYSDGGVCASTVQIRRELAAFKGRLGSRWGSSVPAEAWLEQLLGSRAAECDVAIHSVVGGFRQLPEGETEMAMYQTLKTELDTDQTNQQERQRLTLRLLLQTLREHRLAGTESNLPGLPALRKALAAIPGCAVEPVTPSRPECRADLERWEELDCAIRYAVQCAVELTRRRTPDPLVNLWLGLHPEVHFAELRHVLPFDRSAFASRPMHLLMERIWADKRRNSSKCISDHPSTFVWTGGATR